MHTLLEIQPPLKGSIITHFYAFMTPFSCCTSLNFVLSDHIIEYIICDAIKSHCHHEWIHTSVEPSHQLIRNIPSNVEKIGTNFTEQFGVEMDKDFNPTIDTTAKMNKYSVFSSLNESNESNEAKSNPQATAQGFETYLRTLVLEHWDTEIRLCDEACKAQLSEHIQGPVAHQTFVWEMIAGHWNAEKKQCEEAHKVQLLELSLTAHGITTLA
ncbi:hypothetical protein DFH29DRAFT_880695 [Suillus ampliporus]|nr:hypothetical protein DFH29DRAFT_880695 [Suillus ampliporus]